MLTLYMHRRFGIAKCGSAAQMDTLFRNMVRRGHSIEQSVREWQSTQCKTLLQEVEVLGAAAFHTATYPVKNLAGYVELYDSSLVRELKRVYAVWNDPPERLRVSKHIRPRTINLAHMHILMNEEVRETEGVRFDLNCYFELQTIINTFSTPGIERCLACTEPPPMT